MSVAVSPCDLRVSLDACDPALQVADAVAAAIAEADANACMCPQSVWGFARGRWARRLAPPLVLQWRSLPITCAMGTH
jgi:hypothetical protein